MTLRELGEDRLLEQILPGLPKGGDVVVGAGDDCAAVRIAGSRQLLLLKTDSLVENVHFVSGTAGRAIGWKAMMRVLSDFAAMSGVPQFALVALIASGEQRVRWVRELYQGLHAAGSRFDVRIVGGETSSTSGPTVIVVSAVGVVERRRCILRSGGRIGDDIFVTGTLGGAMPGRHLKFVARIKEARWLTRHWKINAMMDLSDGLGTDLPRLARASNLGFVIEQNRLPLNRGSTVEEAISTGEDYELLFTTGSRHREQLQGQWQREFPKLRLSRIGKLVAKSEGEGFELPPGYVHFQKSR